MFEDMISAVQGTQQPAQGGGGAMDPEQMKKLMLAQFLMGGGAAMANAGAKGGRGSYGRSLAAGMAGGMNATGDVFDMLLRQQMHANQASREDKRRAEDVKFRTEQAKAEGDYRTKSLELQGQKATTDDERQAKALAAQIEHNKSMQRKAAYSSLMGVQNDQERTRISNEALKLKADPWGIGGLDPSAPPEQIQRPAEEAMMAVTQKSTQAAQWAEAALSGKVPTADMLKQAPVYSQYLDRDTQAKLNEYLSKRGTIQR